MPKKRKTREQKILTEHKRQTVNQPVLSNVSIQKDNSQQVNSRGATFSFSPVLAGKITPRKAEPTITISTNEYSYLSIDLLKTALVTCAIVIAEIVIRMVFRG